MFEKEVMISGLKRNSQVLAKLVEEIEEKPRLNTYDVQYYHEMLKKIENGIRKIRKMDEASLVTPLFELA